MKTLIKDTVYFWIAGTKHSIEIYATSRLTAMRRVKEQNPSAINISCHMNSFQGHKTNK